MKKKRCRLPRLVHDAKEPGAGRHAMNSEERTPRRLEPQSSTAKEGMLRQNICSQESRRKLDE